MAIINIHRERCKRPKFTLTLMEEVSTANKALFIGCVITLVSLYLVKLIISKWT